jgi:hypothetical protein
LALQKSGSKPNMARNKTVDEIIERIRKQGNIRGEDLDEIFDDLYANLREAGYDGLTFVRVAGPGRLNVDQRVFRIFNEEALQQTQALRSERSLNPNTRNNEATREFADDVQNPRSQLFHDEETYDNVTRESNQFLADDLTQERLDREVQNRLSEIEAFEQQGVLSRSEKKVLEQIRNDIGTRERQLSLFSAVQGCVRKGR